MTRLLRPTAGDALATVGVLHTTGGLAKYRKALPEMVRDGVIDTIEDDPDREAAVWFRTSGAPLILMGFLARWIQRQTGTLPVFVGPMLFGIGAVGATLMRRSGFWALFVAGILAFTDRD